MSVTITIPGNPTAAKRPRFSRKLGRAYDSQKDMRNCITWHIASQWGDRGPLEGPVELDVTFHMKIPNSASKKRKAALQGQPCLKHVDLDNLLKMAVLDASNGVVFNDDSQVFSISCRKIWDADGKTVVNIKSQKSDHQT